MRLRTPDERKVDRSFVYFIRAPVDDQRIKIGYSRNPTRRLREWGDERIWLAGVPGTRENEQHLHSYFAAYRYNAQNEWFWYRDELRDYVEWLREQPFAARACTPEALEAAWPQEAWLPWVQPQPRHYSNQGVIPFPGYDWTGAAPKTVVADEYNTRPLYLDAARAVLGEIELDPASSRVANRTVRAERYYTIADEALHLDWKARTVWLNPPFSAAEHFGPKLARHYEAGDVGEAILLLGNRCTSTKWFQPLWEYLICFTDHRIHFDGPTDSEGQNKGERPDAGHLFVYMGPNPDLFAEEFVQFGAIVRKVDNGG